MFERESIRLEKCKGRKFSRNLAGSGRRFWRRKGSEEFFLDWQYSNERRKRTIGGGWDGRGRIGREEEEEAAGSKRQTRATVTRFPVPTLRIA